MKHFLPLIKVLYSGHNIFIGSRSDCVVPPVFNRKFTVCLDLDKCKIMLHCSSTCTHIFASVLSRHNSGFSTTTINLRSAESLPSILLTNLASQSQIPHTGGLTRFTRGSFVCNLTCKIRALIMKMKRRFAIFAVRVGYLMIQNKRTCLRVITPEERH